MDRGIWRHLPVFFVLATACLSYYALQRVLKSSPASSNNEQINYEMPRPEAVEGEYDLSGQEIVRTIHRLESTKGKVAEKVNPAQAAVQAQEKARLAAKKKTEDAAAAKKKAQALAQKNEAKKPQLTVQIPEDSQDNLKTSSNEEFETAPAAPSYAPTAPAEADDGPKASSPLADHEIPRMSSAQWKSLLMGQPNAKNANEFLVAYQKKLVDKNSYYQISELLLTDNAEDRQKLGVFLLRQSPSEDSFSILAKHSEDKPLEKLKPQIDVVFHDYSTAGRLPILSKLFYSSNAQVVSQAQLVLKSAVLSQNSTQQQSRQGREARGPGSSPIPTSHFQNFIPALQHLERSNNQGVVQGAQELIDRIKAMHSQL